MSDLAKEASGVLDQGYAHSNPVSFEIKSKAQAPGFSMLMLSPTETQATKSLLSTNFVSLKFPLFKQMGADLKLTPKKPLILDCKWDVNQFVNISSKSTVDIFEADPKKRISQSSLTLCCKPKPKTMGQLQADFVRKSFFGSVLAWHPFKFGDIGFSATSTKSSLDSPISLKYGLAYACACKPFPVVASMNLCSSNKSKLESLQFDVYTKKLIASGNKELEGIPVEMAARLKKQLGAKDITGVVGVSVVIEKANNTCIKSKLTSNNIISVTVSRKITPEVTCSAGVEYDLKDSQVPERFGLKFGMTI